MDAEERKKKTRVSVTMTETHLDAIDRLVEEGLYLNRGEVYNDALRRLFRNYGIRQFVKPLEKAEEEAE